MGGGGAQAGRVLAAASEALDALRRAQWPDPAAELSEAIRHMQMAHRLMLQARPERSQVRQAMNSSRQGAAAQSQQRQNEIDQLEARRNRNFFEQERRVQQERESANQALSRLKELAERQKMMNDEIGKLVSELQERSERERQERQRQLESLREEARRALEQLDRIDRDLAANAPNDPRSRQSREALGQARRQMSQGLDGLERDQLQQARSAGARAMRDLAEAERSLEGLTREAAAERMRQLREKADELVQRQDSILERLRALQDRQERPGSLRSEENARTRQREEVLNEKDELASQFQQTLEEASDLSNRAQTSQELFSRKLGDWLRETAAREILEQIQQSRELAEYGIWEPAQAMDQRLRQSLDEAREDLKRAEETLVADDMEGMRKALERLERLREGERRRLAQARQGQAPEDSTAPRQQNGRLSEQGRPEERQDRPEQQQRQGGQPAEERSQPAERQEALGQPREGAWDARGGGGWRQWLAPRTDEEMREFWGREALEWSGALRDAQALLPSGAEARDRLARIEDELNRMRRQAREEGDGGPRFDLLQELVGYPLGTAAAWLERKIEEESGRQAFALTGEEDVPDRYRERVAEYYRQLAEAE